MKNIFLVFMLMVFTGTVFGQRVPDVLIERHGRTITSSYQGQNQTIIAQIFFEDGVNINIEYYSGSVILSVALLGNHFTDIDSLGIEVTADRTFRTRTETFNSIALSAENSRFVDRATAPHRPPFGVTREFRSGRHITKFEITLPNYKFDVIKYAQAFTVNIFINGERRTYAAGVEELRLLQDAGLIMSLAGLM